MLVPTKLSKNILIWHLLYNKYGSRISYLDNNVALAANISHSLLEGARNIVGWCSEVKNYAGAADAEYEIRRSRLPGPNTDYILEKVSISGGKFVTGGASFRIGIKDTPVHVSQNDYVSKLKWISKKFVVMWDDEEKRG
ncbi:hypothetical protein BGZ60DRAFT_530564 [Tricladium varicosporioides]|nr:hypothetical protein BGZ60DRAFT_530564 [Hymenoscyphus varicosporioides]